MCLNTGLHQLTIHIFDAENTPVKMYNSNVSCAILLSFVKNTCVRDIEDHCKHKHIQLGIELDALRKNLQQLTRRGLSSAGAGGGGGGNSSSGALATNRSMASLSAESIVHTATPTVSSRPPSGASRPTTPATTRGNANGPPQDEQDEELAAALMQQELLEKQLEVVNTAARFVKGNTLCVRLVQL